MSIPNMRCQFEDCIVFLEKGIIFHNSWIEACHFIFSLDPNDRKRASIVLKNQNDNVNMLRCRIYAEEPIQDILKRSAMNFPDNCLSEEEIDRKIQKAIKLVD